MNEPTERIPENNLPVSQVCKAKLLAAKERPDPTGLYLLQLAMWGREQWDEEPPIAATKYAVDQLLGDLQLSRKPARVLRAFYPSPEQQEDAAGNLQAKSPEDAANCLLEDLMLEAD